MYNPDVGAYSKDLQKRRDSLLNDLKTLEEQFKKGKIAEDQYKEKRRKIERAFVEVMDRLAQTKFLMGET